MKPFENEIVQSLAQVAGIVGTLYLMFFGVIAISLLIQVYITRAKAVVVILSFLAFFMMPQINTILGIFYISGQLHTFLLNKLNGTR